MSHGVMITGGDEKSATMDGGIICVERFDKNQSPKPFENHRHFDRARNFQFAGVKPMPRF